MWSHSNTKHALLLPIFDNLPGPQIPHTHPGWHYSCPQHMALSEQHYCCPKHMALSERHYCCPNIWPSLNDTTAVPSIWPSVNDTTVAVSLWVHLILSSNLSWKLKMLLQDSLSLAPLHHHSTFLLEKLLWLLILECIMYKVTSLVCVSVL